MKKSFVIHNDSLLILDELTDDQAGKLFKAIKNYHFGGQEPTDFILKLAFAPFKNQFIRDEEKYQSVIERNRNNGQKGGRPVSQENKDNPKEPKKPSGLITNPKNPEEPKKADSVSDSVSDKDSVSKSKKESESNIPFADFWNLYDKKINAKKSEEKWNKLTDAERILIMDYLPKYKLSKPDKQYRKDPCTFLNNKSWNDEIIMTEPKDKQNTQPEKVKYETPKSTIPR